MSDLKDRFLAVAPEARKAFLLDLEPIDRYAILGEFPLKDQIKLSMDYSIGDRYNSIALGEEPSYSRDEVRALAELGRLASLTSPLKP